tara:strand:- start:226 stop:1341 length:1116 start_codon:yes stop_codon:yes gene_type:complete
MKKNICFVSPYATPLFTDKNGGSGGAEKQFYLFGKYLALNGYDVSFIIEKTDVAVNSNFATLNKVDFFFLGGSKLLMLKSFIQLIKTLKKNKTDITILKTPSILFLPIYIYSLLFKKKFIFWGQTDTDFNNKKELENFFVQKVRQIGIKNADFVIVQNKQQLNQLNKNFKKNGVFIPNIIEFENLKNKQSEKRNILWVGNSSTNKRFEIILELAKLNPNLNFVVAMNVSDKKLFDSFQNQSQLLNNILFIGSVKNNELMSHYNDAFLLLNTSIREGFPNTFLEAWIHSTPVVSVNIDPDNIIENYNLGITFKRTDYNNESISSKLNLVIHKLYNDSAAYCNMKINAIEYIKNNHAPDVVIPKLLKVLDKKT